MKRTNAVSYLSLALWLSLLLVGLLLSILRFDQSRESLRVTSTNLALCEQLARQIEELRKSKSVALERPGTPAAITAQLLDQARAAHIAESQLAEIEHLPTVRIKGTDYRRDDTVIRVNNVELQKVIQMLIGLQGLDHPPIPTALTVKKASSLSSGKDGESWLIELILTRLAFAAQSGT